MSNRTSPRILSMEDDRATACLLRQWLQKLGYAVDLAFDGVEGLAKCRAQAYDVIVVDRSMPKCGGLEVLRTLAAEECLPPAILVTAGGDEAVVMEALRLGVVDYILKDSRGDFLGQVSGAVARVLELQQFREEKQMADRRLVEEALRNPAALLRNLYDLSHDAILLQGERGFFYANAAAVRLFGCEVEDDILGKRPEDISTPLQPDGRQSLVLIKGHAATARSGRAQVFEWQFRRREGSEFPAEVSLIPIGHGKQQFMQVLVRDLTAQKQAETQLRLEESRLDALLELDQMTDASLSAVATFAMEKAVALTGSEIGYLAFVDEDQGLLTMQAWSQGAMAQCRIIDKPIHYRLENTGLWGEAVRQRQPVITNDYLAPNPWIKGAPEGHVPIRRHMNVPVFEGDRIVAVIGIGNKPEAYDESDVRQLNLLMHGMWKHIHRKRSEEELAQYREHLEELVQQRTAELEQTNDKLQEEIRSRGEIEEALRQQRDFAQALIDNAQALVMLLDSQDRVMQFNHHAEEVTGYAFEEVRGRDVIALFVPQSERSRLHAVMHHVRQGQPSQGTLCPIIAKDGRHREIQWHGRMLCDTDGHARLLLVVGHDITERRRMERDLEGKTRTLALHAKHINCLYAISRLLEDKDLALSEILRRAVELIPPAWQRSDDACARIIVNGSIFQTRGFTETLWKLAAPIFVDDHFAGAVEVCYRKTANDQKGQPFLDEERALVSDVGERLGKVVERYQAQAKVRALQQQIEYVLGATKTGLCITDANYRLQYVDRTWQTVYGDPAGKTCYQYFQGRTCPCDGCRTVKAMRTRTTLVTEEVLPLEGNRPVQVTTIPFQNERGEWLIAKVYLDLSRQRRLERELAQAQKLEAIGQLAAGIAHEINTPTQYIGDNTQFLQDACRDVKGLLDGLVRLLQAFREGNVSESLIAELETALREADMEYLVTEIPKALHASLDGVERVATIVRAMKEFSHPGGAEKQAVDLNRAIQSTLTISRNEWKHVADLVTDFGPSLPMVFCYPSDLNQAILNVLVNAAQAIAETTANGDRGKGRLTVGTRLDGNSVEIRISDTGPGIPEAIRSRIFDPFFTTKEVGKGTGQGLAIVHDIIVAKHRGTIHFETQLKAGTTFILRLPL